MYISHIKNITCLAIAVSAFATESAAFAQTFDTARQYGLSQSDDRGTVGFAATGGAGYLEGGGGGSLSPLLEYRWANGWFAGTTNGVGYQFSLNPETQYGVRLNIDRGRQEGGSSALRGMGSIDPKPELGLFANRIVSREITLTGALAYGAGDTSNGAVLNLGAVYSMDISQQWGVAFGVGAKVANAAYLQTYFGVGAAQSASSGYAVYTPTAGLQEANANFSVRYRLNPSTTVLTALTATALADEARNSPLVRNANYVSGVVAVAYSF